MIVEDVLDDLQALVDVEELGLRVRREYRRRRCMRDNEMFREGWMCGCKKDGSTYEP